MITGDSGRMLEFLWFVGYCEEFPSQLALRVGGHPEWNRHVKYKAIKKGYVEVFRGTYMQRVIRSLRLTEAGLEYICSKDPGSAAYILAKDNAGISTNNRLRSILRLHALATGLVMAHNAGALVLPHQKPSLMFDSLTDPNRIPVDPQAIYYYSANEIRTAIQEFEPDSVAKTSRIIGIMVHGSLCFCLYYSGRSRMYWQRTNEENTVAAIDALLSARGFHCSSYSQVIIASQQKLAITISKQKVNGLSRYFTVSTSYNNCYFVENSFRGDWLLKLLIQPRMQAQLNRKLLENYSSNDTNARGYAAVTKDGLRPVVLAYPFDLLELMNLSPVPEGFHYSPILLCFDYQADTIQSIVGPKFEVRPCTGGTQIEQEDIWKDP